MVRSKAGKIKALIDELNGERLADVSRNNFVSSAPSVLCASDCTIRRHKEHEEHKGTTVLSEHRANPEIRDKNILQTLKIVILFGTCVIT